MASYFDLVIVGGGIIGLAVGRELQKRAGSALRLCVVEKERYLGKKNKTPTYS
jgi:L-2-hydroxyglutarate oxidase LhgO